MSRETFFSSQTGYGSSANDTSVADTKQTLTNDELLKITEKKLKTAKQAIRDSVSSLEEASIIIDIAEKMGAAIISLNSAPENSGSRDSCTREFRALKTMLVLYLKKYPDINAAVNSIQILTIKLIELHEINKSSNCLVM